MNGKSKVEKGMRVEMFGRKGIVESWAHDTYGTNLVSVYVVWLKKDGTQGKRGNWCAPLDVIPVEPEQFFTDEEIEAMNNRWNAFDGLKG